MITKRISVDDKDTALAVLGPQDRRIREWEKSFKVDIFTAQNEESGGIVLTIKGSPSNVDKTARQIGLVIAPLSEANKEKTKPRREEIMTHNIVYYPYHGRPVKPRNERQEKYARSIFENDIVISSGPAGTGKTFLAVACALRCLETELVGKIILTRPIVEAGEKLGFLPGDINEKVHPYLKPLYDSFYSLLGAQKFHDLRDDGVIEIIPLAYMRGRTLENSFMILDEAQNTVHEQMKMFLTRLGVNSKMVITGDTTQIDLKDKSQCGLIEAVRIFEKTPEIKFIHFQNEDVVRHPLVKKILKGYDDWETKK